jgi:DNA polymerase III delta prime subunit
MEKLNINKILYREETAIFIKNILTLFDTNIHNPLFKKGIYIYGEPGTGKTTFITNILKELNYDIIKYDAGDIRNAAVIEDITKHGMSNNNVISSFNKNVRKIVIIMDEIDGMNNGDKGGINTLIKIIRPKKTKKQKLEDFTIIPIICIGNYRVDKKIKELMKVCNNFELNKPSIPQINQIINEMIPELDSTLKMNIINHVQGDLRKINTIYKIFKNDPNFFTIDIINNLFQVKSYNDNAKKIIEKLIDKCYKINEHNNIMNETDRTSVGLLWHENIIDLIETQTMPIKDRINFYIKQLDNICFADYIDRITFQKQIWQFNEMSSLLKTFKNNLHFHETFNTPKQTLTTDVRFTKVLTKYSTEYNNSLFIQKLCQKLGMDKKDLFGFFIDFKSKCNDNLIQGLFENHEIYKLDINRIYRFIEKYTKENAMGIIDTEIDNEIDIDDEVCDEDI